MRLSSTTGRVAIALLGCCLLAPAAVPPAAGTPGDEARYLSMIKKQWGSIPAAQQARTCRSYQARPTAVIADSVSRVWADPVSRTALSKPAWRRVIRKYLSWACSGPDHTPR